MGRTSRQEPGIVGHTSKVAVAATEWLDSYLAPLTFTGVARVDRHVNVFTLAGTAGVGLLAESEEPLADRPGVFRLRTSAWVAHPNSDPEGGPTHLLETMTHGWDAWAEATATGDRHWLEVPRRQMYQERDRRTAAIAEELDRSTVTELAAGIMPEQLAGLSADHVRHLAGLHVPNLLGFAGVQAGGTSSAAARGRRSGPVSDWPDFERRLARVLDRMPDESFLILTTAVEGGGPDHFVQFAQATTDLRAEAVTSAYLPPSAPLTVEQESRLTELGWTWPEPSDKGRNVFRMWPIPAPAAEAARLAIETLRSVYAVREPALLRFQYALFSGGDLPGPRLGITRVAKSGAARSSSSARQTTPQRGGRRTLQQLRRDVEAALATYLGIPKVRADEDGDYPMRSGSAIYYLRILDGLPPAIGLFSPVLREIQDTPALNAALNDINSRVRYGRVFADHGTVFVAMELPAIGLTADHVAFACIQVGSLADDLDDVLHGRFGGAITFDVSPKLLN